MLCSQNCALSAIDDSIGTLDGLEMTSNEYSMYERYLIHSVKMIHPEYFCTAVILMQLIVSC